tara:strand:- start:1420 stop:1767 length:348 start_codon:yes stop_codon:yes gene_type:complete
MGLNNLTQLPKIGDLVTFSESWGEIFPSDGKYPYGLVTDILEYDNLIITEGKASLIGTLAFPMTWSGEEIFDIEKKFKVYLIRWAGESSVPENNFKFINEEWFYNNSFIVLQRSN